MRKFKITLCMLVVALLCSCMNSTAKKAVEQGKLNMADSDYQAALNSFQLAIDNGCKEKEIQQLIDIITQYNKARELFDKADYAGAENSINEISIDYSEYSIKKDIDNLKDSISAINAEIKAIDEQIKGVGVFVENKDYSSAEVNIEDLYQKNLSAEQKAAVDELKSTVDIKLKEIEAAKAAAKAEEERKKTIAAPVLSGFSQSRGPAGTDGMTARVTWKAIPDALGYVINSVEDDGVNGAYEQNIITSDCFYETAASDEISVKVKVRAYKMFGNTKIYSNWSKTASCVLNEGTSGY